MIKQCLPKAGHSKRHSSLAILRLVASPLMHSCSQITADVSGACYILILEHQRLHCRARSTMLAIQQARGADEECFWYWLSVVERKICLLFGDGSCWPIIQVSRTIIISLCVWERTFARRCCSKRRGCSYLRFLWFELCHGEFLGSDGL